MLKIPLQRRQTAAPGPAGKGRIRIAVVVVVRRLHRDIARAGRLDRSTELLAGIPLYLVAALNKRAGDRQAGVDVPGDGHAGYKKTGHYVVSLSAPRRDVTVPQVPEQHQRRYERVETMQEPDRAERKIDDVDPVKRITQVCQSQVRATVRSQILGAERTDEHRNVAQCEDTGRDRPG